MNVLSLFDGISCGQLALQQAGIKIEKYYASEVDEKTIQVTQSHFPETIQLGDVTKIKAADLPQINLLIGGSPCQDLSKVGKGAGLKGSRSGLFYEYVRLLREVKPDFFLLENVRMKAEWRNIIDREMGVPPILINSKLFVPQTRNRYYWTNIPIAPLPDCPDWQGSYWNVEYWKLKERRVCPCLLARMGGMSPYWDRERTRKLSPDDWERLQGLPVGYTSSLKKSARYHAIGNGWTVPVIAHIFAGLRPGN